jgi:FtsZ-binding cell division protein ZapB
MNAAEFNAHEVVRLRAEVDDLKRRFGIVQTQRDNLQVERDAAWQRYRAIQENTTFTMMGAFADNREALRAEVERLKASNAGKTAALRQVLTLLRPHAPTRLWPDIDAALRGEEGT